MANGDYRGTAVFVWVLPFIAFLVAPLAFYFGNSTEYVATLGDSFLLLLAVTFVAVGLLYLLLLVIKSHDLIYRLVCGALVGLAVGAWVQSQLFSWDFGPLDGRGGDWSKWSTHADVELFVWSFIVLGAMFLSIRRIKALAVVAQGIILLGCLTLVSSWFSGGYQAKDLTNGEQSTAFTFHKTNNKIVIVLDTFQSDLFAEIAQRWPEEVKFLNGFTFYPNTVGGFPTTVASIPLIVTGQQYQNNQPIKEWTTARNLEGNIADYQGKQGYGVSLVTILPSSLDGIANPIFPVSVAGQDGIKASAGQSLLVLDGGLFRVLPTKWKPEFYSDGNWFLSGLNYGPKMPPGIHGQDLRFLETFEKRAVVDSTNSGEFKFYHYAGAHWPLQIDENFDYKKGMPENRESYVLQSRGALALLRRKLEKLKSLGVYDSAEILVVGDHGSHYVTPADMHGEENLSGDEIPDNVLASSRPLFLYKKANAVAALDTSNEPMRLADSVCVLSGNAAEFACDKNAKGLGGRSEATRTFYYYHWSKEYFDGSKDYMPPMYKYTVQGDVRDIGSWTDNHIEYSESGVRDVPMAKKYNLGDVLTFVEHGTASGYLKQGWSYQEPDHRWSDSTRARALFGVDANGAKPLTLKLYANAFPASGTSSQQVEVTVNGVKVAEWQVLDLSWFEATIPAELAAKGSLDVIFHIKDAVAPCELGASQDCRKLGISAQQMVISQQGAAQ